jgi:hypothetical protein
MKLTTRLIRNISFATMVAVILLVRQEPALAAECGPYLCSSACQMQGGYLGGRGCDEGSCADPSVGCIGAMNGTCTEHCEYCNGQWTCGPIGAGLP